MKLTRPTQADLNEMSHADKDAFILFLFDAFEQLKKRADELENTVKKTSRNSGIPPSMDGLKKAQRLHGNQWGEDQAGKPGTKAGLAAGPTNQATLCICIRKEHAPAVLGCPH